MRAVAAHLAASVLADLPIRLKQRRDLNHVLHCSAVNVKSPEAPSVVQSARLLLLV